VTVRVGGGGGTAFVEVADEGQGIAPEDLPHLFERFYKADRARTGGTGLGLAIALENARLLGGELEASTEPGAGARFVLRLPVAQPLHGGKGGVAGEEHA
jgi:two-component system sensor histidine kinase MtrB